MTLEEEARRDTELLRGKTVRLVLRHRPNEVGIEFTDGTRFFANAKPDGLDISILGGADEEPYAPDPTEIEQAVERGLDRFDADRKVEIPLRDALYAYKVLGEFIAFFHQPMHYPDLASVQRFVGTNISGGLHVLWQAYYERLRDVWPSDVDEAFGDTL